MSQEKIIVLDFGGQFNQLIARRVREAGVYCEMLPCTQPVASYADSSLKGVILTGGPASVNVPNAPVCPKEVFSLGVPVLGICYGTQLMASLLGGSVTKDGFSEYGHADLTAQSHPLFADIPERSVVWMNHTDRVDVLPDGFSCIAKTKDCPIAATANDEKRLYGVQFHPEVKHTEYGQQLLTNFAKNICGCSCNWQAADQIEQLVLEIRQKVGENKRIVGALSGGVDSSVAATLAARAVGDRLTCIFVDHGLLRQDEAKQVMDVFSGQLGLNIIKVDAQQRFLDALKGVTDPEQKRKIIGELFVRIFEEESRKIGADFLLQGTIYPDVIESGVGPSATIKSHHNVGGLPEDIGFEGLIEPLRMFFKDEVRSLGEQLGIPHHLVWRQPFPGPGLAIRIIGEVTEEKLECLRKADAIYCQELEESGLAKDIWQYFAVYTGVRSVGVMGDDRTYEACCALRAVTSDDAMTVDCAEIPYPLLKKITSRIINEVPGFNRVVYDLTTKPPGTIEWL